MNDEPRYFHRNDIGLTFGKPMCKLIEVCWQHNYAVVEKVPIPNQSSRISVFLYHMIGERFRMNHKITLKVAE